MAAHDACAVRLLGSGRNGSVYEVRIGGTACAIKTFHDKHTFETELRAYRAIAAVPALYGHVCPCLGVYDRVDALLPGAHHPCTLRLALLPGTTMWESLEALPPASERQQLHRRLRETLRLLHDPGVCHGDIKEDNVIVCGSDAWLLDFSSASLCPRLSDERWRRDTQTDAARQELRELLQRLPSVSPDLQPRLTGLLSRLRTAHADPALLDRLEAALNAARDTNAVMLRDMLATAAASAGHLESNGATLADVLPGNPHSVTPTLYQKAIAWIVRLGGAARVLQLQL
ncbi:hypothetical protein SLS56_011737 [Neofusicoccum ribis]|uniref:Protein kinase domain-containing protein n=1 Tax=Neofusicoccum ribis TaxID=45134 RepID=A0ABR3SB56_9PEZI